MGVAVYFVLRGEEGWIVRFDGRDYGHQTHISALRAAIAAARSSAENGHESQVLVQWPDGAWVVTWASEDESEPAALPADEPG